MDSLGSSHVSSAAATVTVADERKSDGSKGIVPAAAEAVCLRFESTRAHNVDFSKANCQKVAQAWATMNAAKINFKATKSEKENNDWIAAFEAFENLQFEFGIQIIK